MTLVTGMQGVGKSHRTLQELRLYTRTDPKTGRLGRPALILDTNNEYQEKGIETIYYNVDDKKNAGYYISKFRRPEIRRIGLLKPNGVPMSMEEKKKAFYDICNNFRNGIVLFEDINTYIVQTAKEEITSTLVNLRHRGLDVIMHVQSLSAITTRMFQNARYIRFHAQTDDIDRYMNRITDYEMVKIAQLIVNKQRLMGNLRYFVFIDLIERKIKGCSVDQYKEGLREYLSAYKPSYLLSQNPGMYL